MILMRLPGQTSYTILLTANGRLLAQFSYQFAHEFCHLLSGYEQLHESANNGSMSQSAKWLLCSH